MAVSQPLISSRFPYLPLHLEVDGWHADVEALLDTASMAMWRYHPRTWPTATRLPIICVGRWPMAPVFSRPSTWAASTSGLSGRTPSSSLLLATSHLLAAA